MAIDLTKANPDFKLHSEPLRFHVNGETFEPTEWTSAWIEPNEGQRSFQIQALFVTDPAKKAETAEIDFSEKDVARLYSLLTEFLTETVKRVQKAREGES